MNNNLIPNAFIRWHFATLQRGAIDIETICQQQKVSIDDFQSDGRLLSADQYAAILLATFKEIDDESFASLTRPIRVGSFKMMTHACISCATLRDVIERYMQFYRLLNVELDWHLKVEEDRTSMYFNLENKNNNDSSYFVAFMSCVTWRWLSWMIDKPIELQGVQFSFPSPGSSEDIDPIFKQKINYSCNDNLLSFSNDYLDLPVKQSPESLQTFLINVPQCLLSHYQEKHSLAKQVREYLQSLSDLADMTLAHVAEHFNCSEQSLIRGLRIENSRFKDIREKIRKQRADYLLLKSDLSNQQIAAQLGFTEASVFYRKFKKWFGVTPSQYRLTASQQLRDKGH
jgi:AraC-like DNA-binding protein